MSEAPPDTEASGNPATGREPNSSMLRRMSSPCARLLEDLVSQRDDLETAAQFADRLLVELENEPWDQAVVDALWGMAVVRYSRCFTSGVREGMGENVLEFIREKVQRHHDYLINQRNKLIAHSVNGFERAIAGVAFTNDADGRPYPVAVKVENSRQISDTPHNVRALAILCRDLLSILEADINQVRFALSDEAHSLTANEIFALPFFELPPPEINGAGRRR